MIDIQLFRKDIDAVARRLATRKYTLDVAAFTSLESRRKQLQTRSEQLQARRNSLSKQVGIMKGKGEDASAVMAEVNGIADALKAAGTDLEQVQMALADFMLSIPNLPHESAPVGTDESGNVEVRRIGQLPAFDFPVRDHVDIGAPLGLDFDVAVKLTGARFSVLKGGIARLHRAQGIGREWLELRARQFDGQHVAQPRELLRRGIIDHPLARDEQVRTFQTHCGGQRNADPHRVARNRKARFAAKRSR